MRRYHVWLAVGGLAALTSLPASLAAQGFSVNEHSSCAMGRAGTGVASPCDDGSSMFYNPAGLAGSPKGRTQISVGGTLIRPSGGFTQDATGLSSDLNDKTYPVPALYITHGFTDRFAAGLGVFAPYGLTTDWPTDALGRFSSYKSVIRNIYVQPTLAIKLGEYLKVGAGFDVNFLHLELNQRADLSEQALPGAPPGVTFANLGIPTGTDFANGQVSGSKTGFGYHVGLTIQPTDKLSFGARYLSRQKIDGIDGKAKFNQVSTGIVLAAGNPFGVPGGTPLDAVLAPQFQAGGSLVNQAGGTGVRLPEQLSLGVAFRPADRLQLLVDYGMQNWKVWDTIVLDFAILGKTVLPQDFKRTHSWRFGGEYGVGSSSVVRAGFLTHSGAAPDQNVTPTLPEGGRTEFTAGFGTRIGGSGHVDLAYQYIDQADRRGRSREAGTPNDGIYNFKAHLFGATFTWNF